MASPGNNTTGISEFSFKVAKQVSKLSLVKSEPPTKK